MFAAAAFSVAIAGADADVNATNKRRRRPVDPDSRPGIVMRFCGAAAPTEAVSTDVAPRGLLRAVEARAKAATVSSSKIAVENHMNILERRFLRCRPLFKIARGKRRQETRA
jgi:hypothetical protein